MEDINNNDSNINNENNNENINNNFNLNFVGNVPEINQENLIEGYTIDETNYQNLWTQLTTFVHPTLKMISDEIDVAEFVSYLESKNIYTKAYGTQNNISTLFLFSSEKNNNIIFIVKLILNHTNHLIEYELKTVNEQVAENYHKYFKEAITPLIEE